MNFLFHILAVIGIYCILSWGYALVFRLAGMLSLAYGCYFAIGAYVYALGVRHLPFFPLLLIGVASATAFGMVEAVLSWRLKGDFLFVGSLALQAVVYSLALNWVDIGQPPGSWSNLTNGAFGLPGLPRPAIFGITLDTESGYLALVAIVVIIGFCVYRNLVFSPWGRIVEMSRDDELAAATLGKSPRSLRVGVLLVAAGFGALGGMLYAAQTGFVDPDVAVLSQVIAILAMVATADLLGSRSPVVGAAVLIALPEALRFARLSSTYAANVQVLAYGLLLIGVAHVSRTRSARTVRPHEANDR